MLQGTFDIFTLPEVLGMLAGGSKSGTLEVERAPVAGRVHLREGLCCGVESGDDERGGAEVGAPLDEAGLFESLASLCFELLREPGGTFEFDATEPPESDVLIAVDEVLAEAARRVEEWNEVCSLVPSLDVCPSLATEIGGDRITLSAGEWAFAVSLDGRATVRELVDLRRQSLLDVCRELAALVERGAVRLHDGRASTGPRPGGVTGEPTLAGSPTATPSIVTVAPYGPGVDDRSDAQAESESEAGSEAESEPVSDRPDTADDPDGPDPTEATSGAEDAEGGDDPDLDSKDRGALLRMFSALREG